jgi:hypothetical protein
MRTGYTLLFAADGFNPDLPVKTLPELVEHARKADPPRLVSAGIGSLQGATGFPVRGDLIASGSVCQIFDECDGSPSISAREFGVSLVVGQPIE